MKQELVEALIKAHTEQKWDSIKPFSEAYEELKEKSITYKTIFNYMEGKITKEQKQFAMDHVAGKFEKVIGEWGFKDFLKGTKLTITVL